MSTDPIADLVEHPPRRDDPAPPGLADAVLARVQREAQPRRPVWWPLAAALAAGLIALPAGGGGFAIDPTLVEFGVECLLAAAGMLLLARLAGRAASESPWTA